MSSEPMLDDFLSSLSLEPDDLIGSASLPQEPGKRRAERAHRGTNSPRQRSPEVLTTDKSIAASKVGLDLIPEAITQRVEVALPRSDEAEIDPSKESQSLPSLPDEVILLIFVFLNENDYDIAMPALLRLRLVSQRVKQIVSDPAIWTEYYNRDFRPTNDYPDLFDYQPCDNPAKDFFRLTVVERETRQQLRQLALSTSNHAQLLDDLCAKAFPDAYALQYAADTTPDDEPDQWLAMRYWAEIALGLVRKENSLRVFSEAIRGGASTERPGECARVLAHFGPYTGHDPLPLIDRFRKLQPDDLNCYEGYDDDYRHQPTPDMSPEELLVYVHRAFLGAGFDRRPNDTNAPFLCWVFPYGGRGDAESDWWRNQRPSIASTILFRRFLTQTPGISDVANIKLDPLLLAVTFEPSSEVIFFNFAVGKIVPQKEMATNFPDVPTSPIVPLSIQALLEDTASHIEFELLRQTPPSPYNHLTNPDRLRDYQLELSLAAHHIRLIVQLFGRATSPTYPDLEALFGDYQIASPLPYETPMLARTIGDLAAQSTLPSRAGSLQLHPDCTRVVDFDQNFLVSIVYGGSYFSKKLGKEWFNIGHTFTPQSASFADKFAVIAWEHVDYFYEESTAEDPYRELRYVCVSIGPGGSEKLVAETYTHYELARFHSYRVQADRLDSTCSVAGRYFRTVTKDGCLVPNAWMASMLRKMDDYVAGDWWDAFYGEEPPKLSKRAQKRALLSRN